MKFKDQDYKLVYKVSSVKYLTEAIESMPSNELKQAIVDFLNEDNVNNIESKFLHTINMRVVDKWGKQNEIPEKSIYAQPTTENQNKWTICVDEELK